MTVSTVAGSHPPPTKSTINKNDIDSNSSPARNAAADLIRTLDSAFAEMSSFAQVAAEDAEDARRNARAASEVARRYTARTYPTMSDSAAVADVTNGDARNGGLRATRTKPPPSAPHGVPVGQSSGATIPPPSLSFCAGLEGKAAVSESKSTNRSAESAPPPSTNIYQNGGKSKTDKTSKNSYEMTVSPPAVLSSKNNPNLIAQSHAEDVLSLSLALERAKEALEAERASHSQTRADIEKLKTQWKKSQDEHNITVSNLKAELSRAEVKVNAAEEDAQLALDLAKGSEESREQVEVFLQRALNEIEVLRNKEMANEKHLSVIEEEETLVKDEVENTRKDHTMEKSQPRSRQPLPSPSPISSTISLATPKKTDIPKNMVSVGRDLLRRAGASEFNDLASPISESSTSGNSYVIHLTRQSAEKRSRLRERLRAFEEDDSTSLISTTGKELVPAPNKALVDGTNKNNHPSWFHLNKNQTIANLLRESGVKLNLGGRWFNATSSVFALSKVRHKDSDDLDVEAMVKSYCKGVEVRIGRQQEEVKELEAFCEFLEQKLISAD